MQKISSEVIATFNQHRSTSYTYCSICEQLHVSQKPVNVINGFSKKINTKMLLFEKGLLLIISQQQCTNYFSTLVERLIIEIMIISPLTIETNEHFNSLLTHIIILIWFLYLDY